MMTALATVTEVKPQSSGYLVALSCDQQTSCNQCTSVKSCGTGIVSKAMGNKALFWRLVTDKPVTIGQVVEIGLPEKSLLQSAALVYLVPLLMMIVGAALGELWLAPWLAVGEGIVIACALLFMGLGVVIAKYFSTRLENDSSQQVILLRVLGEPIA